MPKPIDKEGPSYQLGFREGQEAARKEFEGHLKGTTSTLELLDKILDYILTRPNGEAGLTARNANVR